MAELNGQLVKVVKLKGPFVWHQHAGDDEMFLVVQGDLRMEFRDRAVELGVGEFIVVPRGVDNPQRAAPRQGLSSPVPGALARDR